MISLKNEAVSMGYGKGIAEREAALAHTIKNKTEAAYARSDLFNKRRALMEAWADYLIVAGIATEV